MSAASTSSNSEFMLFSDGGSRGNPGPAAIGYVLVDESSKIRQNYSKFIGTATNNIAEYKALIAGLDAARLAEAAHVRCYLDSELVVNQMRGVYKIRQPHLRDLSNVARSLADFFKTISYHYIPRKKNRDADALVNAELNKNQPAQ